jgi:hypothetical protein
MLSEQEKKELLQDAQSEERMRTFRLSRELQKRRVFSPAQFISFLEEMNTFFFRRRSQAKTIKGNFFLL